MSVLLRSVWLASIALLICPTTIFGSEPDAPPTEALAAAVQNMFAATSTTALECPREVQVALAPHGEILCGTTPHGPRDFQAAVERNAVEFEAQHSAPLEPEGGWRSDGSVSLRQYRCCGGHITILYDSANHLVVATYSPLADQTSGGAREAHEPAAGASPGAPPDGPFIAGMNGVSNPRLVRKVDPDFPRKARKAGKTAKVFLQAVITVDGTVSDIKVLACTASGYGFEEAAMDAVRRWRYEPGLRNGEPVPVYFNVALDFTFRD